MEFKRASFSCHSSSEKLDFWSKNILLYFCALIGKTKHFKRITPAPNKPAGCVTLRVCTVELQQHGVIFHMQYCVCHTCVCIVPSFPALWFWPCCCYVACVHGAESDTRDKAPSLRGLLLISETMPGLNKMLQVFLEFEAAAAFCLQYVISLRFRVVLSKTSMS